MTHESTAIRTPDQRLRVFVSSTLRELAEERMAARAAIERLLLSPVMFETGSRPHPPRDLYRAYLAQSDIFVGIYGASYGWIAPGEEISGLEDEYRLADGMPRLVYLTTAHGPREARLDALIDRIRARDDVAYTTFDHPDELRELVARDLALLIGERFDRRQHAVDPAPERDGLPASLDSFVGRERDVDAIRSLVRERRDRLITLIGPGGVGKTRLAIASAAGAVEAFPAGVYFIDLAPLHDPSLVMSAIAAALGVIDVGDGRLEHRVASAIGDRPTLLVVDNLEHLLDTAPQLARLIAAAPGAVLLATSRVALGVAGEHRFEVRPLAIRDDRADAATVGPAEQLFLDRAATVGSRALRDADLADIRAICRALDGLPLAIELAAARTRLLTPAELRERLERGIDVLPAAGPDRPERQRTLSRTIAWSVDLLDDEARMAFDALGVFSGGFDLDAASAIIGHDALEPLARLVDASLVVREPAGRSSRFTMLTTVRTASLERAAAQGRTAALADLHAAHFVTVARREGPRLYGPQGVDTVWRLRADLENLREAARTLLDQGRAAELAVIARRLFPYWWATGRQGEVRAWMRELLATRQLEGRPRATALYFAGSITFGDVDRTDAVLELRASAEEFGAAGDLLGEAFARNSLALALADPSVGDMPAAEREIAKAFELFGQHPNGLGESLAYVIHGLMRLSEGDVEGALRRFILGDEVAAAGRDEFSRAMSEHFVGVAEVLAGDLASAEPHLRSSLRRSARLSYAEGIAHGLEALCAIAAERDDVERAATLLGAARSARGMSGVYNSPPLREFDEIAARLEAKHAGDPQFAAWVAVGADLGTAAAAAYALRDDEATGTAGGT
jgi:predicted ATPase